MALSLSACSAGSAYRAEGCEPVTTVVTGQIGAGVSDEGFVTDNDLDLVIGIGPGATACR